MQLPLESYCFFAYSIQINDFDAIYELANLK